MGIFQQFPYSNFHEFNLDQIIKIMREMQDEWENTKTEWASYKEFIDDYFSNLDVTQEVLTALRVMAANGELNNIIDPTIAQETADWLSENITPTTPIVDASLTIAGAAADAKVTGDRFNEIKNGERIYHFNTDLSVITTLGNGRFLLDAPFPAGKIKCIRIKGELGATLEARVYTKTGAKLYIAALSTGTIASGDMAEIPINKEAFSDFYIEVHAVSGRFAFKSNADYDIYAVAAAMEYNYPISGNVAHYEFGVDVVYDDTADYLPLGKNYLLVGDSYLEGYTSDGYVNSWGVDLCNYMNLEYNSVSVYQGGVGFIPGAGNIDFESLATNAPVPDKSTITHIIVCGGYNDAVHTTGQTAVPILNKIDDFVANISALYPNANIYIGMIGYRNNDADIQTLIRTNATEAYQTANRYGKNEKVRYLNNVEWTLTDADMASDGYHPNANGQMALAFAIKNALLTGSAPLRTLNRN